MGTADWGSSDASPRPPDGSWASFDLRGTEDCNHGRCGTVQTVESEYGVELRRPCVVSGGPLDSRDARYLGWPA